MHCEKIAAHSTVYSGVDSYVSNVEEFKNKKNDDIFKESFQYYDKKGYM
jgi:hypothetical protein